MTQTRTLLNAVINRLAEHLPGAAVLWYPANVQAYRLPSAVPCAVLVGLNGATRNTQEDRSADTQGRTLKIGLTLLARAISDGATVLDWLDQVRAALLGFSPDGHPHRALVYEGERFVAQEVDVWIYASEWSARDFVRPLSP